jgi:hypothetical protein
MRPSLKSILYSALLTAALSLFQISLLAQVTVRSPLISLPVDETQRTQLRGNTHPLARPEFDRGVAPPDLPMDRMLLVLKRSPEQESDLRKLIDDQQDQASPNFHKWLTPEEFGQQFGPTDQDIQTVTLWLQAHGFQVAQVSKGRTVIEFSGTAAQVQEALHTSIHKYAVNGEEHWANASDPEIPAALAAALGGVLSLHNFHAQPMHHSAGEFTRSKTTGELTPVNPLYTLPRPGSGCGVQNGFCYGVGPYDFAAIYNVSGPWGATPAIDGTGQTIAIVGETDINPQDVTDFRNFFGLPASNLQVIHDGPAPGILHDGEETEADLDVEWSGAVAKGATIDFVVAQSTETTQGIDLSALYIIDNNLTPVMSESYGECELGLGNAGNQFFNQLWQQAAAEGITVFLSSGDSGAAGCDNFNATPPAPSRFGLRVSGFASTPYNVAVGGTDFNDLTNGATYWNATNATTTQASAKSYIPETTWNDSCTNPVFGDLLGFSKNAETNCNNGRLIGNFVATVGGSGGKSNCTSSDGHTAASCAGGYGKPSWQTALTPADGARDIPDVSLYAAGGSPSGSFYIICEADRVSGSSCDPTSANPHFLGEGGTSASAPAFAGIMALVNQKTSSRQGNANYVFYKLAGQQPASGCNSSTGPGSSCVFNDVTTGTIAMPCATGSPDCTTATSTDSYGVLSGYSAGPGYDLATGLGSVNVANLVNLWSNVTFTPSLTTLVSVSPTTITHGQPVNVSVTVAPKSGSGTPVGTVSLMGGPNATSQGFDDHSLSSGTAAWSTTLLPGGTYNVTAHYAGDGTFGASDSATSIPVVVNKENSTLALGLVTFDFNGHLISSNATTAPYGSPYILRVGVTGATCSSDSRGQSGCPTGSVSLTDNGNPLDAGTYALNSLGYAEDQFIQLSGGSHHVQAVYAGDNSFSGNSTSGGVTITPVATFMDTVFPPAWTLVNSLFSVQTDVSSESYGVAPTGVFTFYLDGKPLSGALSTSPRVPCGNDSTVCLNATLSGAVVSTPGPHMISVTYNGDGNYAPSTSAPARFSAFYPTTTTLTATAPNPQPGASVTLTALIDTPEKGLTPTGTVSFSEEIPSATTGIPGNVMLTPATDGSGNSALQATLTFAPTANNIMVNAVYSGDSDFQQSGSGYTTTIRVAGTDFAFFPGSPTAVAPTPGTRTTMGLTIDGQASYNGTVNFTPAACSGLPAESSCSFIPASVTGSGATQVTITTTGPHQAAINGNGLSKHIGATAGLGILACVFLLGTSRQRRSWSTLFSLIVLGSLLALPSCGGGGSSTGGGGGTGVNTTDPGTPTGSYTITVTATSGTLSHNAQFTLVVQ